MQLKCETSRSNCMLSILLCLAFAYLAIAQSSNRTCEAGQRLIRKEWHTLSLDQRRDFVSAVHCLSTRPSKLNRFAYPGALNQFLDFAHIRAERVTSAVLTGFSHAWHRHYLWLFEQTLHQECNYSASLPYWDFGQIQTLKNATMFDGSDASLSGNGAHLDLSATILGPGLTLPAGSGGGCVTEGPFAHFNTTLLPIVSTYLIDGQQLPLLALESNLNCLVRDFNDYALRSSCNATSIADASAIPNIAGLDTLFNGVIGGVDLGLRSGIGFDVGGQMASITAAAQDPLFFLSWAMLDRIYASWQASHPAQANDQFGTHTSNNAPPSANVTLDTIMPDWRYLEPDLLVVADLMNTTGGVLCYEYDSLILPS